MLSRPRVCGWSAALGAQDRERLEEDPPRALLVAAHVVHPGERSHDRRRCRSARRRAAVRGSRAPGPAWPRPPLCLRTCRPSRGRWRGGTARWRRSARPVRARRAPRRRRPRGRRSNGGRARSRSRAARARGRAERRGRARRRRRRGAGRAPSSIRRARAGSGRARDGGGPGSPARSASCVGLRLAEGDQVGDPDGVESGAGDRIEAAEQLDHEVDDGLGARRLARRCLAFARRPRASGRSSATVEGRRGRWRRRSPAATAKRWRTTNRPVR